MKARLGIAAVIAGFAVVVATVVVVLQFGRVDPSPPSLRSAPNPAIQGEILYREEDCLVRIAASGADSRKICLPLGDRFGAFSWFEPSVVAIVEHPGFRGYNLETGQVVEVPGEVSATPADPAAAPDGAVADVDTKGRVYVTAGTERTQIADFDTEGYRLRPVLWSPDSRWIVLSYSPPRSDGSEIWILSRDGTVQGTLATDAHWGGWLSWRIEGVGVTPTLEALGGIAKPTR